MFNLTNVIYNLKSFFASFLGLVSDFKGRFPKRFPSHLLEGAWISRFWVARLAPDIAYRSDYRSDIFRTLDVLTSHEGSYPF